MKDPCGWEDLRTSEDGKKIYETFVDAARARGLLKDDSMWIETVKEVFGQKSTVGKRIRWLAMFLATANVENPKELLDEILQLRDNWLVGTRAANKSLDDRRQYVLQNIEWFLRANGVRPDDAPDENGEYQSACEYIRLPRPKNIQIHPELFAEVVFNKNLLIIVF